MAVLVAYRSFSRLLDGVNLCVGLRLAKWRGSRRESLSLRKVPSEVPA